MLYSTFINEIHDELRGQAKIICYGNTQLQRLCYDFINEFCVYMSGKEKGIMAKIEDLLNPERDYQLSNGVMSCSLIVGGNKNSILSFSILQNSSKIIHKDRMVKLLDVKKEGYVYFIKSEHGIKVGKSSSLKNRLKIFEVKLPFKTEVIKLIKSQHYNQIESDLHKILSKCRLDGEWFLIEKENWDDIYIFMEKNNLSFILNVEEEIGGLL